MATWLLALIVATSAGTYIYLKFARSTGQGNVTNAVVGSIAAGLVIFIVIFTLLKTLGL